MSRTRLLTLWVTIGLLLSLVYPTGAQSVSDVSANVAPSSNIAQGFQPVVRMLGVRSGATIEWVVTVSNVGDIAGQNVVLSNQLPSTLRVDSVQVSTGTTSITDNDITVIIPLLEPQAAVEFSIITQTDVEGIVRNTICTSADNYAGEECATALSIMALPATGETPQWRTRLQWMSLLTVSISLLMIGIGLFSWQFVHDTEVI